MQPQSAQANAAPHRPLDIVVPVSGNADLVRACVDSLLRHCPEISGHAPRLIVVNDSPQDVHLTELLREYEPGPSNVVVVRNDRKLGRVQSMNRGLAMALRSGHDALLVAPDSLTYAGTLPELLRAAAADPMIGFASPRSNHVSICSLPFRPRPVRESPELAHRRWSRVARTMPAFHFAPTAASFYVFISHTVLANFGFPDPGFGEDGEETQDLVMRAGKVGWRAVLVNRAFVYHAGSGSPAQPGAAPSGPHRAASPRLRERHPEYEALVSRYTASSSYQAERMMSGLLDVDAERVRLVFDLTDLGLSHNGTSEYTTAVLRSLALRWNGRLRISGIGSAEAFSFHGLDRIAHLERADPARPGAHAIGIRLSQPQDGAVIDLLTKVAPINVYAFLDSILEDCAPLRWKLPALPMLWDHVARHADGLVFISRFSESTFCARHPDGMRLPRLALPLPTRIGSYRRNRVEAGARRHVLIMGNQHDHKGSEAAAKRLSAAYPSVRFIVLGGQDHQRGNVTTHRSGGLEHGQIQSLYADAAAVVLPSHVEGFGLGLMHALAAGRPIAARRIHATEEILATLDDVQGVFLFDNDLSMASALAQALHAAGSSASDSRAMTWDDWADRLAEFALGLVHGDDVFWRLQRRLEAGDMLNRAVAAGQFVEGWTRQFGASTA